jgi:hypothetical protein
MSIRGILTEAFVDSDQNIKVKEICSIYGDGEGKMVNAR